MVTAVAVEQWGGPVPRRHLRAVSNETAPPEAASPTLEELLLACGRGSSEAFDALYAELAAQVIRVARRVVHDPDMAEDVAQEALVEAWRTSPKYDPARGSARAWVLTIAHRRAIDRVRREQRQRDQVEAEAATAEREAAPGAQDTVVEVDFRRWQSARVREALDVLSDLQREAIELAYYGGRTQAEIAEQLGVPLGTTKTRIRDGMTRLREALKEVPR
ncbi:sigma-70 family RNA polymerase sigma factor [Demequina sp. NBRC 110056]|uniref:sigma-70 family RNA polymerase sigma factor n=1 Tax=Demequina sp. NBRC 110056 TaxID=1570345 RepID=UPI0009FC311D|nr:sigma-70 family RNA polymerase sigma factor [Demequina sp. NBRC 110056]